MIVLAGVIIEVRTRALQSPIWTQCWQLALVDACSQCILSTTAIGDNATFITSTITSTSTTTITTTYTIISIEIGRRYLLLGNLIKRTI